MLYRTNIKWEWTLLDHNCNASIVTNKNLKFSRLNSCGHKKRIGYLFIKCYLGDLFSWWWNRRHLNHTFDYPAYFYQKFTFSVNNSNYPKWSNSSNQTRREPKDYSSSLGSNNLLSKILLSYHGFIRLLRLFIIVISEPSLRKYVLSL